MLRESAAEFGLKLSPIHDEQVNAPAHNTYQPFQSPALPVDPTRVVDPSSGSSSPTASTAPTTNVRLTLSEQLARKTAEWEASHPPEPVSSPAVRAPSLSEQLARFMRGNKQPR